MIARGHLLAKAGLVVDDLYCFGVVVNEEQIEKAEERGSAGS